ncbi:MAG: hypothetical protein BroJett025_11270 [Patescibacteria group bacterium]|nr:MAG: hypothetical protein BroJett025_11270 [Patescibacteria group bacterium]
MQLFVARRILLTLAYSEQFQFPLKASELFTRLLTKISVTVDEFVAALTFLVDKQLISYDSGYFVISGLSGSDIKKLVDTRVERAEYASKKWSEVLDFISVIRSIPFITGVAVTGSLAVHNTIKDDDIDFMIVTPKNRLWLARLLVVLYASLRGKRRSFAKEEKNSWCFNLWIEESDLQLPVGARSVYEAYEVIQATWVLSRGGVANRFRRLNDWTKKIVPRARKFCDVIEQKSTTVFDLPVISQMLDVCNQTAYYFQFQYMKSHMTREKVSKSHAFFHPRDTKSEVFKNWKKTILRLL